MYKVQIGEESFTISQEELDALDMMHDKENDAYHILHNTQSYHIKYVHEDDLHKEVKLLVNGSPVELKILDRYDQLVEKMGLSIEADNKVSDINAPMPGLILDIMVKVGDSVEENDSLLILEAMKMENIIKAGGAGIVKEIHFEKGQTVDKGALIIEMES